MSLDLYAENILDELHHPQNRGVLPDFDIEHDATNTSCGDSFKVQLKLDAKKQKIQHIAWQGNGCAISTAALSQVSSLAQGAEVTEILGWDKSILLKLLGLPTISVGRERCLTIGLVGIQQALRGLACTPGEKTVG